MVREKDCNITPFVQSSPRLNDQTSRGNGTKVLQRSRSTVRETNVQLDSHQRCAQEYRKHHRFGGDRIDHDVPSYNRNHIGIEDKRRQDDQAWIGGNGGKCRMGSPLNSGREHDIESTPLTDQGSRSKGIRAREYSSGGGEYVRAIREADMLGCVPRDRKSSVVRVG